MNHCSNCGAKLTGEPICANCGAKAPTAAKRNTFSTAETSKTPAPAAAATAPQRGRRTPLILGAVVVAGLATVTGVALVGSNGDKQPVVTAATVSASPSLTSTRPTPPASAATPATTASPAQELPSLAVTPQQATKLTPSEARSQLKDRRQTDRYDLDAVRYSWAPQVSSKCEGLDNVDLKPAWFPDGRSDTSNLTAQQILAFHLSLANRDGALLVTDKDVGDRMVFSGCSGRTMWMAVIPKSFGSATAANRWCDRNGYPAGECAARYVVDAGDSGAKVKWRT